VSPPAVLAATERRYAALGPAITRPDPGLGWQLLRWLDGPGSIAQPVEDLVYADGPHAGWSLLFDIDRIPDDWLPWLAMVVGVTLRRGITADQQRAAIIAQERQGRGRPDAIIAAAQRHLTGSRRVVLRERDGSPYRLTVRTYASQTPDPAVVARSLEDAKPIGLVLTYEVLSGPTWDEAVHTWDSVDPAITWDDAANALPGDI
jgi:hypothetical protein